MLFMLLIHHEADDVPQAELPQMMQEYMAFRQDIVKTGKFKAADRLESSSDGATVRVRNGGTLVTDGPFAETREQLGGYFIVDAKDRQEAIANAFHMVRSLRESIADLLGDDHRAVRELQQAERTLAKLVKPRA